MLHEPRLHTVLKSIATSTKSFAVIVKIFAWITGSESSSWFALVQNWWIQSESSCLVELLRIAIIVKIFCGYRKIFCYSQKNLNTVSFVQEAGNRGSFACLHVLNACLHVQRRHPRHGAKETAWVQKNSVNNLTKLSSEQPNTSRFSSAIARSRKMSYIFQLHSI